MKPNLDFRIVLLIVGVLLVGGALGYMWYSQLVGTCHAELTIIKDGNTVDIWQSLSVPCENVNDCRDNLIKQDIPPDAQNLKCKKW